MTRDDREPQTEHKFIVNSDGHVSEIPYAADYDSDSYSRRWKVWKEKL